jgi:hypothetical protein
MHYRSAGFGMTCSLRVRCSIAEGTSCADASLLFYAFDKITLRGPSSVSKAQKCSLRWLVDEEQLDAWHEEDEQVFVHPRDPYHRVDILDSSRHVKVRVNGELVAETQRPKVLFETGLPPRYTSDEKSIPEACWFAGGRRDVRGGSAGARFRDRSPSEVRRARQRPSVVL